MTFAAFKRQVNEDLEKVLELMEEEEDYQLPPDPSLEDYYVMFFTAWNDNIRDVVFET